MRIICYGDSNTYGYDPRSFSSGLYPPESRWVDILAGDSGWELENWGENGRTIPERPPKLPARQPDLFLVMLGSNDLLLLCPPGLVLVRMEQFLCSLPLPWERLFLLAPPPFCPGEWLREPELLAASRQLGPAYRGLAEKLGIPFADSAEWQIPLAFDGLHFTEEGNRIFAGSLYAAIKQYTEAAGIK
ncbi:MAG: GDSL-type esterase/lipase family protein, partial [Bacillota bacterium]|nr:GDSL-type esterase/lipase family protein [Bacillota bacterium]